MTIKVLVVDDSGFFRRRITEILRSDKELEVIDTANNGMEAVEKALRLKPDVITMDIEMPVMDGITAVKRILAVQQIPILMFSSLTTEGAKSTFEALEAGAVDYLPKRFEDISSDHNEAKQMLVDRVREVGKHGRSGQFGLHSAASVHPPARAQVRDLPQTSQAKPRAESVPKKVEKESVSQPTMPQKEIKIPVPPPMQSSPLNWKNISAVAIGTSTGGPVALQAVLAQLPKNFSKPIVLIQHMPGTFTGAFAQRLDHISNIHVKEAIDGDILLAGTAYLAPGGKQMKLQKKGTDVVIRIEDSSVGQTYKPCVDVTFQSVAEVFGGHVLAIVLTGMGADGREGAKKLKALGAHIWAQDQASCVVYGMPAAIAQAGIADDVLSLQDIGKKLASGMD